MSGFLRVFRRVANKSQVYFTHAEWSQKDRKSAPTRAIFSCFLWQHRETFQMTSCYQAPKVRALKSLVLQSEVWAVQCAEARSRLPTCSMMTHSTGYWKVQLATHLWNFAESLAPLFFPSQLHGWRQPSSPRFGFGYLGGCLSRKKKERDLSGMQHLCVFIWIVTYYMWDATKSLQAYW